MPVQRAKNFAFLFVEKNSGFYTYPGATPKNAKTMYY